MRRVRWALLAALVIGLIEFAVMLWVGSRIGVPLTLLLVALLSLLGVLLLRREGMKAWRRLRAARQARAAPGRDVLDGVVGLTAAVLLIVPGLLTSLAGLLLLVPPLRRLAGSAAQRAAERRVPSKTAGDLFGPHQVRVRQSRIKRTGPPPGTAGSQSQPGAGTPAGPDDIIEGEIVD